MAVRIIVVGGGTSGLTAAIAAARAGADVTILESREKPGKKLLATGNGRCNLTNQSADLPESYFGTGTVLARSVTESFRTEQVLQFFSEIGLLTQTKALCVYPCTGRAASVLSVLFAELRRLGVRQKFSERVRELSVAGCGAEKKDARFLVRTDTWTYPADAVILACGSKAAPSLGGCEDGYHLVRALGHSVIEPCPALVPVTLSDPLPAKVMGVRSRAQVILWSRKKGSNSDWEETAREEGEVQWTGYGLSGIVIFQLSRHISCAASKREFLLCIDLLPDYTYREVLEVLKGRAPALPKEPVSVLLQGLVHEKLIPVVLGQAKIGAGKCHDLSADALVVLAGAIKNLRFSVSGTQSFEQAQVCAGGIDCREATENLESVLYPGLFFCGEILDVDGPCGGFNLHWAWASGYTAGTWAAEGGKHASSNQ